MAADRACYASFPGADDQHHAFVVRWRNDAFRYRPVLSGDQKQRYAVFHNAGIGFVCAKRNF